jgi:hypothetical protein
MATTDRSEPPVRFLLTCPARTGSTMLNWFLRSHPDLCVHGEVLAPSGHMNLYGIDHRARSPLEGVLRTIRDRDPVVFLRDFVWQAGDRAGVGFKGKYEELLRPEYAGVLEYIRGETGIRILHLWRENLLERYLSQYLAVNVYGMYNVVQGGQPPSQKVVSLPPEDCEADFQRTERRRAKFRSLLGSHPVLELTYEDLLASQGPTLRAVQQFLGVEERTLETKTLRIRTRTLRATIKNYDELADAFRDTPYGRFFIE